MKTIKIDEKEYVSKEDYEQDIKVKDDELNKLRNGSDNPLTTIYTCGKIGDFLC